MARVARNQLLAAGLSRPETSPTNLENEGLAILKKSPSPRLGTSLLSDHAFFLLFTTDIFRIRPGEAKCYRQESVCRRQKQNIGFSLSLSRSLFFFNKIHLLCAQSEGCTRDGRRQIQAFGDLAP